MFITYRDANICSFSYFISPLALFHGFNVWLSLKKNKIENRRRKKESLRVATLSFGCPTFIEDHLSVYIIAFDHKKPVCVLSSIAQMKMFSVLVVMPRSK